METKLEKLLTEKELEELNKFGTFELTASHVYLYLSNKMQVMGFFGVEKFFLDESDDERKHFKKIQDFANNLNCELRVETLQSVNIKISSIKEALEVSYKMEKDLMNEYEKSASNNELSLKVRLLLQEFLDFQVKATGEFSDLLNRLELTNNMLLFDQEFK
jgi:ferritin